MAEKVLENRVCKACGADVRPQALFCYNCGAAVAPDVGGAGHTVKLGEPNGSTAPASESEIVNENNREIETKVKRKQSKRETSRPIEKPSVALEENLAPPTAAIVGSEQAKLKTAAALRKNAKTATPAKKKTIEVVWEEPDSNAPNVWFLIAALILSALAAGILLAAFYLK